MKAFLLAAGYGTRLRPITDTLPKCLVPINGQPLLGWWFQLLRKNGIDEVLVNTHYLPEQVEEYTEKFNREHGHFVRTVYEADLLGSGGTILDNKKFIPDGESFCICYADNLTDINLKRMVDYHQKHEGILTTALFHTDKPKQCGIAAVNSKGQITEFVEKPESPKSDLANGGIYVADYELINILETNNCGNVLDMGKDILPKLTGAMYAYFMSEYLIDVGTPDNYEKAQREWKHDYYKDTVSD